jgi:hypothetical protein
MSPLKNRVDAIDWQRLLQEFAEYEPEEPLVRCNSADFEASLVNPLPEFVGAFIARKGCSHLRRAEAVRVLYGFLLHKRYEERLNLLYFAFDIFDDNSLLPAEIVNQTPFPHEDGVPQFRHRGDSAYRIGP